MASQEQEILIRMQQRAAEAAKYAQLDYSEQASSALSGPLMKFACTLAQRYAGAAWEVERGRLCRSP